MRERLGGDLAIRFALVVTEQPRRGCQYATGDGLSLRMRSQPPNPSSNDMLNRGTRNGPEEGSWITRSSAAGLPADHSLGMRALCADSDQCQEGHPRQRCGLSTADRRRRARHAHGSSARCQDAPRDRPPRSRESPVQPSCACLPPQTPATQAHRRSLRHSFQFQSQSDSRSSRNPCLSENPVAQLRPTSMRG